MNNNVLMVCHVSALFTLPLHHAWLRCSGTVGDAAFKELCAMGAIPIYVNIEQCHQVAPLRRVRTSSIVCDDDTYTLVISIRAYERIPQVGDEGTVVSTDFTVAHLHITHCSNLTLASSLAVEHSPIQLTLSIEGLNDDETKGLGLPNHFLSRCTNLQQLTLIPPTPSLPHQQHPSSPWSTIQEIPVGYLDWCSELTTVDLTPFSHITEIRTWFLNCCGGIKMLDVSPLCNITTIPSWFMHRCGGLSHLDLSPLINVHHIQAKFLNGCVGLQTVVLPPHVTNVDGGFMAQCTNLASIDLSPLSGVTSIHEDFLSSCTSLKHLDLTPLTSLATIGVGFGMGCTGLVSIDLSGQGCLEEVGSTFLSRCTSLTSITWKGEEEERGGCQLKKIGKSFMSDCKRLKVVDFNTLKSVEVVGKNFMHNCVLDRAVIPESKSLRVAFGSNLKAEVQHRGYE